MAHLDADRRRASVAAKRSRESRARIWRWPLLLALLSLLGLLFALLGQGGIWWVLSWIALAIPLAVIVRCLWRRSVRAAESG